jgi:hypothetical protein
LKEKLVSKGLAEGSANLYLTKLKKLNGDKPYASISFLKNTADIKKKFDAIENINTRKSYLTAVVSVLNNTETKQYNTTNIFYKALLNSEKYHTSDEEMSQKQKDNWITWEEVLEKYAELDDIVKMITEDDMNEPKAKKDLTTHLVLAFYVLTPPRRNDDYYLMKLDTDNKTDESSNYYRPETSEFIFNQYKTKKNYGTEKVIVNSKLKNVIDNYVKLMKKNDGEYLLAGETRNTPNFITKILNRIFGKKIGASMLRHIYLTSKYGTVKEEMKKDAELMAHSSIVQQDYIKKE